jgi:hypothetical protein
MHSTACGADRPHETVRLALLDFRSAVGAVAYRVALSHAYGPKVSAPIAGAWPHLDQFRRSESM